MKTRKAIDGSKRARAEKEEVCTVRSLCGLSCNGCCYSSTCNNKRKSA